MSDRPDLDVAVRAALAGAEVVRDGFGIPAEEEMKGAVDPVTAVDRRAEEAILTVIHAHRPDDAVLAEESGGTTAGLERRWIVDPLDGTVNFVSGVPHVGVSVALWENDRPLAGVVVDVLRDDLFAAAAGGGCTLNGRRVRVSERSDIGSSVLVTGFPYDRRERAALYTAPVTEVLGVARGIRRFGTASLDFAWVAAGRLEGYWEFGLKPWDVAAGILLVQEAGGRVTDETLTASRPGDRFVMATNDLIHRSLHTLLQPSIEAVL